MFEPSAKPRIFGLPPGVDFPGCVVSGLLERSAGAPPERLAHATVFVNTSRMRRRMAALFDSGPALLLPRIRLITELGRALAMPGLPLPVSPLRRRLELAQLVTALIASDPGIAPRAAVYDLADSLAALMDEMQGEGVPLATIESLEIDGASQHWERSRKFLALVGHYLAADATGAPDPEARQRMVIERLVADWANDPPADPVIVAGSTGSRGATLMLMEAVARLPQGAVILPGFDTDLPGRTWDALRREDGAEDHPQFRFLRLLDALGVTPDAVESWSANRPPSPERNRLVSLALRPAPVTDEWRRDGPELGDMGAATAGLTLIEAPDPRAEARAIALKLREAAETGRRAALVSPDRMLTRRVTALLDRWDILPDDSAGRPLALSPPGRLLRQAAALLAGRTALHEALALLKHPLVHTGGDRGDHLRMTRDLELWLRDTATPWVDMASLGRWIEAEEQRRKKAGEDPERAETRRRWSGWLGALIADAAAEGTLPLAELVDRHLTIASRLVAGSASEDASELWDKPAGRKAAQVADGLVREAGHGGAMPAEDYVSLFQGIIAREEVRDPDEPHPDIMIWGTLEARVQGAELVILGGLNDGTWPELPAPDPWLNRRMRAKAGLLLPERRIGLAAHDFQQAIAAPEVVLTRALRDDNAQPVPSRWLNRLTNLLEGLGQTGGPGALEGMRQRGRAILSLARRMDRPAGTVPLAPRPSPRPPVVARPRRLSFTQVETLIRDPYAIYARHILKLSALNPLRPEPDALLRGNILHDIFARFMDDWSSGDVPDLRRHLASVAREEITACVHWPLAARLWLARIDRIADRFIADEAKRLETWEVLATEVRGKLHLPIPNFEIHGRADRLDRSHDGALAVLDYKSGSIPSAEQMEHFSVQLLLEALIAEGGGFEGVDPGEVQQVVYIGLGNDAKRGEHATVDTEKYGFSTPTIRARFERLIATYDRPEQGYTAKRAVVKTGFAGDYDHLSRYGEWDETDAPEGEDVA